jgi:hypothetical protein
MMKGAVRGKCVGVLAVLVAFARLCKVLALRKYRNLVDEVDADFVLVIGPKIPKGLLSPLELVDAIQRLGLVVRSVPSVDDSLYLAVDAPLEVLVDSAAAAGVRCVTKTGIMAHVTKHNLEDFEGTSSLEFFTSSQRMHIIETLLDSIAVSPATPVGGSSQGGWTGLMGRIVSSQRYRKQRRLLTHGVSSGLLQGAFPLHNRSQLEWLHDSWVESVHEQPIDAIVGYFGERIGLYFAFLGHYLSYLVIPSLAGIAVYLFQQQAKLPNGESEASGGAGHWNESSNAESSVSRMASGAAAIANIPTLCYAFLITTWAGKGGVVASEGAVLWLSSLRLSCAHPFLVSLCLRLLPLHPPPRSCGGKVLDSTGGSSRVLMGATWNSSRG